MQINSGHKHSKTTGPQPSSNNSPPVTLKSEAYVVKVTLPNSGLPLNPPMPPPSILAQSYVTAIHSSHAFLRGFYPSLLLLLENADMRQNLSLVPPSLPLNHHLNQISALRAEPCAYFPFLQQIIIFSLSFSLSLSVCTCFQAADLNPTSLYVLSCSNKETPSNLILHFC